MGGGQSTSNQVYENFSKNTTSFVNERMQSFATNMKMSTSVKQSIQGIEMALPPAGYCKDVSDMHIDISQRASVANQVALSLDILNKEDFAAELFRNIQTQLGSTVKKEKDGMLAFTDNTNIDQSIKLSSETETNIRSVLKQQVEKYVQMDADTQQSIKNIRLVVPCAGVSFSQGSVVEMIASDTGRAIADTLMKSKEMATFISKIDSVDQQKATDLFNSLFNNVRGAIDSVASSLGLVGSSAFITVALIAVAVIMFAPSLLGAVFGGGGGGGGGDEGGGGGSRRRRGRR